MRCFRIGTGALLLALAGCGEEDPRMRVAALLEEPDTARFQAVRERGSFVCGELNGKESGRGYGGYRRFVYDKRTDAALIDPGAGQVSVPAAAPAAACSKSFAYQTVEERLNCAHAPAEQAASDRQREFDTIWARACAS